MILEVAAARVSPLLEIESTFHAVISPGKSGVGLDWGQLDPVVQEMHAANGLRAEIEAGGGHAFSAVYDGLKAWLEGGPHTLAGDSVHFDYRWLLNEMPHVAACFSHRLLDVSAFRVARELCGFEGCPIAPGGHRAWPDVQASIAKARWHLSRVVP
jgi:oligoribonuclease (3'-5' exoribonuclease)